MIFQSLRLKPFLLVTALFLNNCDNLKRFGQEKYTCNENKLSIYQIDIIKTNSLKKAYMLTDKGEIPLKINTIDKEEVLLSSGEILINIQRKKNEISVSNENKIHFLKCKNETFNM